MQAQETSNANLLFSLPISEQIVFLNESIPQDNTDKKFREHYLFTLISGCIADLFIQNKIHLENNKIILNNNPKKVSKSLTVMMKEILASREEKTILSLLFVMNYNKMSQIENLIAKDLIGKQLLIQENEGALSFSKNSLHAINNELTSEFYNLVKNGLNDTEKPSEKLIYLLTLLDEIDFLPKLSHSKEELHNTCKHLKSFIRNNHNAKMLLQSIQNELKLKELEKLSYREGGNLSLFGRF